jgi:hypothetical protein
MTRSLVIALAILAVVVVGGELLSPRPVSLEQAAAAMPSLQELHLMANVHKLPLQDIEDQSLIYPSANEEARPKP